MGQLANSLGNRPIIAGRELTKLHETLVEQPIKGWLASNAAGVSDKGEHVIVVLPPNSDDLPVVETPSDDALAAELGQLTELSGMRAKEASKLLAAKYGLSASAIYALHARPRDQTK